MGVGTGKCVEYLNWSCEWNMEHAVKVASSLRSQHYIAQRSNTFELHGEEEKSRGLAQVYKGV